MAKRLADGHDVELWTGARRGIRVSHKRNSVWRGRRLVSTARAHPPQTTLSPLCSILPAVSASTIGIWTNG